MPRTVTACGLLTTVAVPARNPLASRPSESSPGTSRGPRSRSSGALGHAVVLPLSCGSAAVGGQHFLTSGMGMQVGGGGTIVVGSGGTVVGGGGSVVGAGGSLTGAGGRVTGTGTGAGDPPEVPPPPPLPGAEPAAAPPPPPPLPEPP